MSDHAAPLPAELRPAAESAFGDRLDQAEHYANMLATEGVVRGLIGPREAPRIWDRHVLNCAAIAPMLRADDRVADVGSGAGLPGIVLAIARPDIRMVLIESLARRTAFLDEVVLALGLDERVSVVRARAEEVAARPAMFHVKPSDWPADVVTARAVAPLDRLAGWCLPLSAIGGRMLAMKGASAADEMAEHAAAIGRLGGGVPQIRKGSLPGLDPVTVVEVVRERVVPPRPQRDRASVARFRGAG